MKHQAFSRKERPRLAGRKTVSRIPGRDLIAAMDGLAPCGPDSKLLEAEIDAGIWGRFRVTFRPCRRDSLGGWPPSWYWLPESAETLGTGMNA